MVPSVVSSSLPDAVHGHAGGRRRRPPPGRSITSDRAEAAAVARDRPPPLGDENVRATVRGSPARVAGAAGEKAAAELCVPARALATACRSSALLGRCTRVTSVPAGSRSAVASAGSVP